MQRPELYDRYINWCNGDNDSFENEPLEVLRECMGYEKHLKSKKGRVIEMRK